MFWERGLVCLNIYRNPKYVVKCNTQLCNYIFEMTDRNSVNLL